MTEEPTSVTKVQQSEKKAYDPIENWNRFEAEFLDLQAPDHPSGLSLYSFVTRSLKQFHLEMSYSEAYILHESYLRAYKQITEKGVDILNPAGWIRRTSYNVIRELNRQDRKFLSLEEDILTQSEPTIIVEELLSTEADTEDDFRTIKLAFEKLDPQEQRLLTLKVIQGKSWGSVAKMLKASK